MSPNSLEQLSYLIECHQHLVVIYEARSVQTSLSTCRLPPALLLKTKFFGRNIPYRDGTGHRLREILLHSLHCIQLALRWINRCWTI